jgi:peptidoglycan hydrolase-like protein with peptidoglycan-binding domain
MRIIRSLIAPVAALAVASGVALLPALASAPPAGAAVSCTGTSEVLGASVTKAPIIDHVRVPTVGNGTANWACDLGPGNDSVAVQRLQIALNECNLHAGLAVDGIYGSLTGAAVRAVQNHDGVPADGVFGPVTAFAMQWPVVGSNGGTCGKILFDTP